MERKQIAGYIAVLLGAVMLWALAAGLAQAQSPGPDTMPQQSPAWDEAQAQAIDRSIMCPVCPAETIDQAQVPIARQMRQVVRQKLAAGESPEEILEFFAQRYGRDIVAFPPKSGLNLVAWLFPVVGIGALLGAGVMVLRAMSGRRATALAPALTADAGLQPYLARVDQELARLEVGGLPDSTSGDPPAPSSDGPQERREDGSEQHG